MIREKTETKELVIDLTGPDGNAFSLMANAQNLGRQLGWSKLAVDGVIEEMKLGDYEHLVQTFDKHFGDYIILER
ncbi:MAG: hypothetical protein CMA64_00250 [Euryarchaeota archaeon]|jgi:hypothetical protein|nr:hypothetical protein [Euryarchaeota archaeon]